MENTIGFIRNDIETIDLQILNLLKERLDKIKIIGEYKKNNNLPIYDEEREKILMNRLKETNIIPSIYIEHLWTEIFFISRCIQKDNN